MGKPKIIVVMPAYNAEKTVEKTFRDIPEGSVDGVILVDDASRDRSTTTSDAAKPGDPSRSGRRKPAILDILVSHHLYP